MSKIKSIIFDFDGVIAKSVNVKTEAFAELYRPYGEEVEKKVVEHHLAHGGVSRFEKFRIYHKEFLNKDIDETGVNELAAHFSELVLTKVVEAPYVKGAYEFISKNYKNYKFFISTGTPTNEMNEILKLRKLSKYFIEVHGSPESKIEHVKKILKNNDLQKDEVVFIGDAISDRNAAKKNEIEFIGRYTTIEDIKKEKHLIKDFTNFNEYINKL